MKFVGLSLQPSGKLSSSRRSHPFLKLSTLVVLAFGMAMPMAGQVMITRQEVKHDLSPPLRDLVNAAAQELEIGPHEAEPLRIVPLASGYKPADQPDPVLQRTAPGAPGPLAPTVINNFDGIGQGVPPSFNVCCIPPDTNGAVGLTQYVQWVNLSFAVYDKQTTNITLGPALGKTLWSGFGGDCEATNNGDPIVVYDKLADRWIFSQFSVSGSDGQFLQCVAVSTTSDATGTFNRYAFAYSNFDDYPKMGVWPDAYYVTFNMFGTNSFVGADACAYDRNAMLNGQAATQVCFQQGSSVSSLLPSDVDGHTAPPAGSPNYMMTFGVNSLNLYKFHVDFATPANSTFTGPTTINVAPFTPLCNGGRACVPQSGTGSQLDSLADRLMYRLAYRNFGNHESLVVNHAVAVNSSSGVRWYEIQNPNGTPTVAQQSTYAPDANFRWMGSIAMDASGDIALGYSVSSASSFPAIAIAARLASDPTSTLGAETTIIAGTGSQNANRWGDYSAMQVDPVDDCTFWYTTEYEKTTGSFNWNTRIASFKFPGCGQPDLTIAKGHTGNFTQGQTGATYSITVTNAGEKDTSGTVTVVDTLPAKLTATAISGTGWSCTLGTLTCTRSDVLAASASYPAITVTVNVASDAPGSVTNTATVSGGGETNTANDTASDPTTIIQNGPDLAIVKGHTGSFVQGTMGTYTIMVSNVGLSATDGTTVTVTDSLPTGLTANTASGTGWTCVNGPPISCTRSDALASNAGYPAISVVVNIANNASGSVVNTATVSGGGDTNSLNNSASDPTTITPPPPDLTITKTHTGNFNQGQAFAAYTITVKNVGTASTNGQVTVTDTLPAGLTSNFMFGTGWNCNSSTVTCTRNDVLAGSASYPPITLNVNVSADAAASVTNSVIVSGGGDVTPGNNTATDPTTINQVPDLTITKTHTPDPFVVGQTGAYTITVSNVGHGPTTASVNVSDFLPSGLTATSITGTGWSCTGPTFINCTRSDVLAAGNSYPPITVTVSVTGGGPSVTNFANVNGGGEFNTANDNASDLTNITAPVLAITKTHTGNFTVGEPGTYKITVSNTGKIATVGTVTVSDNLPTGLTLIGATGTGWSCSTPPTSFVTCTRSDALAPNASYPVINLTVAVGNTFSVVTNFASVTGGGDGQFHSASDTTNINAPLLAITKTHAGNFTVGQPGTYTIIVSNKGTIPTVGTVTVTDSLPSGMTATAMSGTGWTCPVLPATQFTPLACTRSDELHPNQSYPPITLTVNVTSGGPFTTNFASVAGGGDGNFHQVGDPTTVNAPVLGFTKTHSGTFTVGQNGTYIFTVSNTGTSATSGTVTMTDFLPFGMTATAITGAGWSCPGLPTTFVTCTRSDALSPGNSYPAINMTVSLNTSLGNSATNFANLNGGGDSQGHFASDTVNINTPSLSISKSHVGNFALGKNGAYTITVSNNGNAPTSGTVNVNDFLPQGLTAIAISASGWTCSSVPTVSVGCSRSDSLAVSNSYPAINLTVSVNGGAPSVTNNASVSGGGDPQFHSTNDPTNIDGPTLAITKTHTGNFTAGQTGTYTITVSNTGKQPTNGTVIMTDNLPQGLTATTISGAGWSCSGTANVTCTRSDSLANGSSYPAITLTVNVTGGGPGVTNTASVTGGGDGAVHTASDPTTVIATTLGITKSHTGDFVVGQAGTYTLTVTNTGNMATVGTVTVSDPLPFGLAATATSGTGWNCSGISTVTCTRSDPIAAGMSYPPITVTVSVTGGSPSVTNVASVTGGGDSVVHQASDLTNVTSTTLGITKTHTGDFILGQTGTYTITVSNTGQTPTGGTVTVSDFLPFSLNLSSASGSGWTCSGSFFVTCMRSDSLAAGSSYPAITLVANIVSNPFGSTITNTATVTGGGDSLSHSASDTTTIKTPVLAITKTHNGNFTLGQAGTYTITVSNAGNLATTGAVNVSDFLPAGMTAIAVNASGWACSPLPANNISCSRSDSLASTASYPAITLIVSLDPSMTAVAINQVNVSGGGDASNHSALDPTNINLPDLAITKSHIGDFTAGQQGAYTLTVSNVSIVPTAGGTVTVNDFIPGGLTPVSATGTDWNCTLSFGTPDQVTCTRSAGTLSQGNSYPPITVNVSVAPDAPSMVTNVASVVGIGDADFTNNIAFDNTNITGFRFVPVTPCRVVDTRNPNGPFGGPFLGAGTTREFDIPNSACNIPATAQAYSINVTVVPKNKLAFLTMFPCGQNLPLTSTLNSDGRVKAAAAIVPAGTNGGACAFATDDTEFIMDIDGYFVPASTPAALAFYPLTPCRVVDTRNAAGPLGGPSLVGNASRTFPVLSSSCTIPNTAQAYSLNYTSVPKGKLGFLTTWPAGQTQPLVSTLNAPTGTVTANAAIVPAGTNGDVNVFVTDDSNLVIDINGYFAPPGQGGLSFFPLTPCRALDSRIPAGTPAFTGQRDVNIGTSGCGASASAQAFVLNATVVPAGPLDFLTLWPQGATQPLVSTLNASDAAITSNLAIVPTTNGSVSAFVPQASHLVLDISGFFAP